MPNEQPEQPQSQARTLGTHLRQIREAQGLTLRAVEQVTGVSNAYLSQLENGKIEKPAPHFLHKLAEAYAVPYEMLMEKAGYIVRRQEGETQRSRTLSGAALASIDDLSTEEEAELMKFVAYLRSKRPRKRQG